MKNFAAIIWLIVLFGGLCLPETVLAQNIDSVDSHIRSTLSNHYERYPQEKIFLHTDADLYAGGQTIWYKVYATAYGKPSDLSGITYVVLTDSAGNAIRKNKLPMKDGRAHGNIDLPDSLHSGWYQLACFTAWTMNFGEKDVFHKPIYIQNLGETIAGNKETSQSSGYHISFFPEGGDPVEGDLVNIAFKATDEFGAPATVTGEVLNSDKKIIAKIITDHDGMGLFSMEGYAGKKNTALVTFPDKTVGAITLPAFKKTGIALKVRSLPANAIEVRIAIGNSNQYQDVILAAHQDNGTFDTYPLQLNKGINVFMLKKDAFQTGILRFTLFDRQGIPQAERIVFINKNDQLKLLLTSDTLLLESRKKSVFKLNALDNKGTAATGNFSISVTDADAIGEDGAADNVASYLLMSAELTGKVYHPAYYFKNNSDSIQRQLDLVMLTNGWRHFKWNKDTVVLKNTVERSQYITGRIIGYDEQRNNKNPVKIKMLIQHQDSSKYFTDVEPDSAGRFIIGGYDRSGRASIFLQVADKKNRVTQRKIDLYNTFADSLQAICYSPLDSTIDSRQNMSSYYLANALKDKQQKLIIEGRTLKTVNIHERKLTPTEEIIKDHVGSLYESMNAKTLDLVTNPPPSSMSIIDYITGKFPGLQIHRDTGNTYVFQYHGTSTFRAKEIPFVYINEAPASVADLVGTPITDVALIRFIPPPIVFAPLNGGTIGAIMIYVKNAKDDRRRIPDQRQFNRYTFHGYSITREFAAPDYSKPQPKITTDTRTTLYWNHDVDVRNGEVKFSFYNSDNAKHFRVIIQGMDSAGKIGYLEKVF